MTRQAKIETIKTIIRETYAEIVDLNNPTEEDKVNLRLIDRMIQKLKEEGGR